MQDSGFQVLGLRPWDVASGLEATKTSSQGFLKQAYGVGPEGFSNNGV